MAAWRTDPLPHESPRPATREVGLIADGHRFHVRVYGAGAGADPCLVWVHGGGFTAGSLDMSEADGVARELNGRAGAVVVSVGYGLVPEVSYPTPHRQVAAALGWTIDHATDLGVDPARISLGGGSAGAALCLAAARELVAVGGPLPAAMVLAYPVAHRNLPPDPAQDRLMAGLSPLVRFPPAAVATMCDTYLGGHPDPRLGFVDLEPGGSDAALAGLPAALVLLSEYDDLRSSGELLVRQGRGAGWAVERRLCPGMLHGHLNRTPVIAEVDRSLDAVARVVRRGGIGRRP